MPRKPNYDFERREREKAKASKKEARQKNKAERKGDEAPLATEEPINAPADQG